VSANLKKLNPQPVWAHFATLCEIPRASYHEAALIEHLKQWALEYGIESTVDAAGNLILRKQASAGYEASSGVILQGHLDMVCQVNSGTIHDFLRDPLNVSVQEGGVVAENTTLGADNGIGVALALAALEAPGLIHPALEVLLTVNEESGMDGARGLLPGTLQGKTLINLDTEEWGLFYLGCAGGVDVEVHHDCEQENLPAEKALLKLEVSGLCGGHSGIDIHLGRGNAIKLLSEALLELSESAAFRLLEMKGGTARNAIPREAYAIISLPAADVVRIEEQLRQRYEAWQMHFWQVDPNLSLSIKHLLDCENSPSSAVSGGGRDRLLGFLGAAANGVACISEDFSGVTDTSVNLGVVSLEQGVFKATFKVRSLHDQRASELADKLITDAAVFALSALKHGAYPAWTPNPSSELLALCQQVYSKEFGQAASSQVIHAGLECGLLAASHPHLEMISFGPDIRGAHAPGERVKIESVADCYTLLKAVLQALATK